MTCEFSSKNTVDESVVKSMSFYRVISSVSYESRLLVAVPLLLCTFINESHMTQTTWSLQNTSSTPVSQATPTAFELYLCNEKQFDLHMFTGNITNSIATININHKG